jgi:hypothetical protein
MKKKLVMAVTAAVALAAVAYIVLPGPLVKRAAESERKAAGLQQRSLCIGDDEMYRLWKS